MILVNLVANALKFTKQGYIKINLQLLDVTPVHTTFALSVEDTGIGMTAEQQTQLFQRFARVAAPQYEGSGLGLFISKRFIEWMGGKLDVKSREGEGSQFTIQLTCDTAGVEEKLIPPALIQLAPTPLLPTLPTAKHTLVVEDNLVNQRMLCRQLEQAGHSCEVANNGEEAVDKWSSSAFDLIFMDIEMPVMDGLKATRIIREKELQAVPSIRTPIIGVSAYATNESIKQAMKAGMDGYITKLYKKEEIYAALKKWTESRTELSPATKTASTYLMRQTFMPPPPQASKAEETEEEKKPEDPKDYAMMGPKGYK